MREKEEKKKREMQAQMMLKSKVEDEKRLKREQIEEYKFRKELDKQREK